MNQTNKNYKPVKKITEQGNKTANRVNSTLIYLLTLLYTIFPLGTIAAHQARLHFSMFHNGIYAMSTVLVSICIIVFFFRKQRRDFQLTASILAAFLPLLSMLNAFIAYAFVNVNQTLIFFCAFPNFICTILLGLWIRSPRVAKTIGGALSAAVFLPMSLLFLVLLLFTHTQIVQEIASPQGNYIATVIERDEGALGGSTSVEILDAKPLNLLLIRIGKEPKQVYRGQWGEAQDIEILWVDEQTVSINGETIRF